MTVQHYKELWRWKFSVCCAYCQVWLQEYKQVSCLYTLFQQAVFFGINSFLIMNKWCIWGGVGKSLARPTFRCHRTESIVSLERGVCSCAELQVLSCYRGWKEACQATRTISTTLRRELPSSFLFLQGKVPKEIHAILTETLGEHAPLYGTFKNWVAHFKCGDISTCDVPRPGLPKQWTPRRLLIKFTR